MLTISNSFNTTTTTSRPFSLLSRQPTTTTTTTPITSTLSPSTSPTITTSPLQTRPFSASASLAAKRTTYNPSRRVQKRRHGFLARLRTRSGRMILKNRRAKGKKALSW